MAALLEMVGIRKRFGGTVALDDVSFSATAGEVHALLGENGAGKSTLMKILVGALRRDAGTIRFRGEMMNPASPAEARRQGIVEIFQELTILPELTVAQNIFLSREKTRARSPLLDHYRMNAEAERLLAEVGVRLDVRCRAGAYSIAQQQMIEIARALGCNAGLVIMDEPTSSLSPAEVDLLFAATQRLTACGTAVIYVSHRMSEILRIANRATILRDGRVVETMPITPATDRAHLVRQLIGRSLSEEFPPRAAAPGAELLRIERLTRRGSFNDVSFTVRRGEVVGLFGLLGAGRTQVARAIFGADSLDSGRIIFHERPLHPRGCRQAISAGIVLVPEDRKEQGVLLNLSVQHNVTLPVLDRLGRLGLVMPARVRQIAAEVVRRLGVKAASLAAPAWALSGGNQQKLVLAKWIARGADLFILDEPTRGIDVAAKREIHALVNELTEQGCGVLLISSEPEEVLGMSDRIYVMYNGRIAGEFSRPQATDEALMLAATGN